MCKKTLVFGFCLSILQIAIGQNSSIQNIALKGLGGTLKSWEKNVHIVPEHEPYRANDATTHTFWTLKAEDMPGDLGVEWKTPIQVSALIIRYFDGRAVRGPITSRTQEGARVQAWLNGAWKDIKTTITGSETNAVRYVFDPVITARIRLLFTEFSDPTSMQFPEKLGIHISEFEAYEKPPFQIYSSDSLTEHPDYGSYLNRSNESPWDDGGYEIAGPLIVEPKQTKIFSDTLSPTLIVAESDWSKQPALAQRNGKTLILKNGFLQLTLSANDKLKETSLQNLVTKETVQLSKSHAFHLLIDNHPFVSDSFSIKDIAVNNDGILAARINVILSYREFDVTVHYEIRNVDHFFHKWLTVHNNSKSSVLYDVTLSDLDLPNTVDVMAGHELTYPVSRLTRSGFFSCLETMYWDHVGNALTYYPGKVLNSNDKYETEKAVVGVYRNTGEIISNWDIGVKDWIIEYQDQVSPIREEWPDFYCEGWAANLGFAAMKASVENTEKRLQTASKMGVKYMDTYEPLYSVLSYPKEEIQQWMDLCNKYHIGTGFWIDWGSGNDWGGNGKVIKPHPNLLSKDSEEYYKLIVSATKEYNLLAFHWGDFLQIFPVTDTVHPYLGGKYSIYQQGQRVLKTGDEIRAVSPNVMLGADGGMTNPQWVRHTDSRCFGVITDNPFEYDHHPALLQDIHLDRLYSDMNRGYNYRLHYTYLRPWFRQLNTLNHYGHDKTMQHDKAGFRFSLLSALGLAGQLVIHDVPVNVPESEIQFTKHWVDWAIKNKEYLKQNTRLFDRTYQVTDVWSTDPDALAGFSHIKNDRGFIFLINHGVVEQKADLVIGIKDDQSFVIKEVYPSANYIKSDNGFEFKNGGHIQLTVPAKQVRIVWIEPAAKDALANIPVGKESDIKKYDRYIGSWEKESETPFAVVLKSQFTLPDNSEIFMTDSASTDAIEIRDPWAYDKAYLVFLMQDEKFNSYENWIPDNLTFKNEKSEQEPVYVTINNIKRVLVPFKTVRNQREKLTRCYYLQLTKQESRTTEVNKINIVLPKRNGLVFSGAYIDLPDQMPDLPDKN